MILQSLELENIRSYVKEKINIPRGITLFEGDMGSGKSSILMAIEFALFGLGDQKGNSLLTSKQNEGKVILEFEIDEQKYEICRKLKRVKGTVSQKTGYIKNGNLKENLSSTELKKRIIQILRFNEPGDTRSTSRIYRYAIYTPQEQMNVILSDVERRLETIRKAFDIEGYKIAIENSSHIATAIDKISARFELPSKKLIQLDENYFKVQKEIAQNQKQISQSKKELGELDEEQTKLESKILTLKNKEKQLIKINATYDHTNKTIQIFENEENQIKKKLKILEKKFSENQKIIVKQKLIKKPTTLTSVNINNKIKELRKTETLFTVMNTEITKLSEKIIACEKQLGENKNLTNNELKIKLKKMENELIINKNQKKKKEQEINQFKKNEIESQFKIKEITKSIEKFSKLSKTCPICEQSVDEKYIQKIEKLRKNALIKQEEISNNLIPKIRINENELKKIIVNNQTLEKSISILENNIPILKEYVQFKNNLETYKNQNAKLKQKFSIPQKENQNKDPINYYLNLNIKLQEYVKTKDITSRLINENLQNRIIVENLESEIHVLNKEIKKSKINQKIILKQIQSLQKIENEIRLENNSIKENNIKILEKNKTIASLNTQKIDMGEKLNEIKKDLEESKIAKEKFDKCNDYYKWIKDFFIPVVENMEIEVMRFLQQDFDNIYQNWYSMLIDDPSKESRIDENFTPLVEQDGYEIDIEHLSGGEKTSVALAYRLTLNSLIRKETESLKSNLLILDEPTYGFSKSQLVKVRSILNELKSEQIILVSHEKELEDYAQNVYHVTKENGLSKISKIYNS